MSRLQYIEKSLFLLFLFLLPTQLTKHFWPSYTTLLGLRVDYLSPTLYTTDIVLLLLFCTILLQRKYFFPLRSNYLFILILFFLLQLVATGGVFPLTLYGIGKLCECLFVWHYVRVRGVLFSRTAVFYTLLASLSLQSFLAIAQYMHQRAIGSLFYLIGERFFTAETPGIATAIIGGTRILRPYGTLPHPNILAGYILISLLLLMYFLNKHVLRQKVMVFCVSMLGGGALILSMSRSILLALACLFLGSVVLAIIKKKWQNLAIWSAAFFLFSVLFLVTPLGERFSHITTQQSFIERKELLSYAWEIFLRHPLIGVGINNFLPHLAQAAVQIKTLYFLQPVHNVFMLVLVETGIIGSGLFLYCLWATWKQARKEQVSWWIVGAFIVIMVTGMVDHYWWTLQQGQLLFAFVMGLLWQESTLEKKQRRKASR